MSAITWMNVNGPSNQDGILALRSAQQMGNDAFGNINALLKQQQTTDNANWDNTKVNNTNAFLNAVQAPDSVDAFAAQREALRQQLLAGGAQIDQVAARNALDGREAMLKQRGITDIDYTNKMNAAKSAPIFDQHRMLTLEGRAKEAKALQDANSTLPGWSGQLAITNADLEHKTAVDRATAKWSQDQSLWPYQEKKLIADLAQSAASTRASNAQADAAGLSAKIHLNTLEDTKTARDALKLQASAKAVLGGTLYENGEATGKDMPVFRGLLKDNKSLNDSEKEKMMSKVEEYINKGVLIDGQKVPLPKDTVMSILGSAYDSTIVSGWNRGGANHFEKRIEEAMGKRDTATVDGKPLDFSPALNDYLALKDFREKMIVNPVVPTGKGGSSPKSQGEYKPHKPTRLYGAGPQ